MRFNDDEDWPGQSSEVLLDAGGGHDSPLVVDNEVVIGLVKAVLLEVAAADGRDPADEAPGEAGKHHQHAEADKPGPDDGCRALGVDGVRDSDRDGSDEHEADTDGNGD